MTPTATLSPLITRAMAANPSIPAKTPLAPQVPPPLGVKPEPLMGDVPGTNAPSGKHIDISA